MNNFKIKPIECELCKPDGPKEIICYDVYKRILLMFWEMEMRFNDKPSAEKYLERRTQEFNEFKRNKKSLMET